MVAIANAADTPVRAIIAQLNCIFFFPLRCEELEPSKTVMIN